MPETNSGRLVIMFSVLFGLFLIPIYIGSLLRDYMSNTHKKNVVCKNCGLKKHDFNATYCKMCGKTIYQEFDGGT